MKIVCTIMIMCMMLGCKKGEVGTEAGIKTDSEVVKVVSGKPSISVIKEEVVIVKHVQALEAVKVTGKGKKQNQKQNKKQDQKKECKKEQKQDQKKECKKDQKQVKKQDQKKEKK